MKPCLANSDAADCAGAIVVARRLAEDQKEAGMLSEAEATCRGLSSVLRDNLGTPGSDPLLLSDVTLELARVVRARGRLDEARQLCEQANSLNLVRATLLTASCDCQSVRILETLCRLGTLCSQGCPLLAAPCLIQLPTATEPHQMRHGYLAFTAATRMHPCD